MKYQLIAVDMDGTLLNSQNEVSERNQRALKQAIEKGVKVVIATGRVFTSARVYAELLGIETPIIACNGALIRNHITNEVLFQDTINLKDSLEVINICQQEQVYFHFYDQEKLYVEQGWATYLEEYYWGSRERIDSTLQFEKIKDAGEYLKENPIDVLKFVIVDHRQERLEALKPLFQQIKTIELNKSWYNNLEIMNLGVSKGQALKQMADIYGIGLDQVIAFGDNYNDLSMAEFAGTFVAMGNSDEAIKHRATYVTANNDLDGVALGIEKYVLNATE